MIRRDQIDRAAGILADSELVLAFTGAGVSQESGLPTFRDAQTGLWENYRPEDLATPSAFQRNPQLVWSWYLHRLKLANETVPNPGHMALSSIAANVARLVVVTQNVDQLHERAGSKEVIHLHGQLGRFRCSQNCHGGRSIVVLELENLVEHQVPQCPDCGSYIRPDVVWFGELLEPDELERALNLASNCDSMLVIGTSGVVQPAAQLPFRAKQLSATLIVINPVESEHDAIADVLVRAKSGEALPALAAALNIRRGRG